MSRFVETRVVPGDLEDTAAVVLNWTRDPEWRTAVRAMTADPDGRATVGQRLVETMRFAGATFTTPTKIVQATGTSAAFVGGSSTVRVQGRRSVEPAPTGTRVTIEVEIRFTGLGAPLTRLLAPSYRRRHSQDLDRLATLLTQREGQLTATTD
jgi:Polyketide cyclase / dehydrase and lipid transport